MDFVPLEDHAVGMAALVPGDDLHHRGFAHDHALRAGQARGRDGVDQRRRAGAADFLVIAERDLERAAEPSAQGERQAASASASKPFMSAVPRP